jgi:ATP-dependent DNA ligase
VQVAVPVPPPLALARATDVLHPRGVRQACWEPKFDGWRVAYAAGRLWSRHGTDLTRYFPDLMPVLRAQLPDGVVLDAEVVIWEVEKGCWISQR